MVKSHLQALFKARGRVGAEAVKYIYNWKWVYNLAVYSLHRALTGHVVGVDMKTGRPFCEKNCGFGREGQCRVRER